MLNWLLVFVPIAAGLHYLRPDSHTLIFITAALAIVPLAGWLGRATEHIAERTSEGVGGLLNATFGNAAEMIIAIVAMQRGLHGVVKASLTGSIIGNILLVMGASALAGGLKYKTQEFNATGARVQATMLTLAAVALVVPAAFHYPQRTGGDCQRVRSELRHLDRASGDLRPQPAVHASHAQAVVCRPCFGSGGGEACLMADDEVALGLLAVSTALIAWMSEMLVGLGRDCGARLRDVHDFCRHYRGRHRRQCGRA